MTGNDARIFGLLWFMAVAVGTGCNEQADTGAGTPVIDSSYVDSPFGMHSAFFRPFQTDNISYQEAIRLFSAVDRPYEAARDINIKWLRLTSDIYWADVQPTKEYVENGRYDWTFFDTLVGKVPAGINILGTISVGKGRTREHEWSFIDKNLEADYLRFVSKAVERYDGDGVGDMPGLKSPIRHWQIENEPAVFYETKMDWRGFSHVVEITYEAIKQSQPEARIALGGLAGGNVVNSPEDPYYTLFLMQLNEFYFPLLRNLHEKDIALDVFDIHYYSGAPAKWPHEWEDNWRDVKEIHRIVRKNLDENGYADTEIWITETATTEKLDGEEAQAASLVKRYIYPLSLGVKKVFWWNMVEGEYPLEADKPANHFGLVYDGIGGDDPGYGVRKLAYYAYKKMVATLSGSDWSNIQVVPEAEGIHVYRFIKRGKPVWVAWSDNPEGKAISISSVDSDQVTVTSAVPRFGRGEEVSDFATAFEQVKMNVRNGAISIFPGMVPVYVEAI